MRWAGLVDEDKRSTNGGTSVGPYAAQPKDGGAFDRRNESSGNSGESGPLGRHRRSVDTYDDGRVPAVTDVNPCRPRPWSHPNSFVHGCFVEETELVALAPSSDGIGLAAIEELALSQLREFVGGRLGGSHSEGERQSAAGLLGISSDDRVVRSEHVEGRAKRGEVVFATR